MDSRTETSPTEDLLVKSIFPIMLSGLDSLGTWDDKYFAELKNGNVWPQAGGSLAEIPPLVSKKTLVKAREWLGLLEPPILMEEE